MRFQLIKAIRSVHSTSKVMANAIVSEGQVSQLKDLIPLVDENDKVLGPATKKECHLLQDCNDVGLLHRAFSVFLFNSNNELLLQQRSRFKITFPGYFTNTCCSHPAYNDSELEENNNLGIKLAAQRRLEFELGVYLPIESFKKLTRIHYFAKGDGKWGEHEIDHVIICKADVCLNNVNVDEVQKTIYVNQNSLTKFLETAEQNNILITPWFRYISEKLLYMWWDNLDNIDKFQDEQIHKAGNQS